MKDLDYETLDNKAYANAFEALFVDEENMMENVVSGFGQAYLFSNENLDGYISQLDLNGKRVFTVGSSGDQLLNLLFYGAKDVTTIDRSLFFEEFIELKIAAIKNLSFEEFKKYIVKKDFANIKYYQKISHSLNKKSQVFWDMIHLENFENLNQKLLSMFQNFGSNKPNGSKFYQNEEDYLKLQQILKAGDYKLDYITADYSDFSSRLNGKADLIILSNIVDHVKGEDYFNQIELLLKNNLNENGEVQFLSFFSGRDKVFAQIQQKYFPNVKLHIIDVGESEDPQSTKVVSFEK